MVNLKNKDKVEIISEDLQKHFEIVEKGKKEASMKKMDKLDRIFTRRRTKDELKDKVLTDKVITH
jgi:hypothetical protein